MIWYDTKRGHEGETDELLLSNEMGTNGAPGNQSPTCISDS